MLISTTHHNLYLLTDGLAVIDECFSAITECEQKTGWNFSGEEVVKHTLCTGEGGSVISMHTYSYRICKTDTLFASP